jgi:hypothetical protein
VDEHKCTAIKCFCAHPHISILPEAKHVDKQVQRPIQSIGACRGVVMPHIRSNDGYLCHFDLERSLDHWHCRSRSRRRRHALSIWVSLHDTQRDAAFKQ